MSGVFLSGVLNHVSRMDEQSSNHGVLLLVHVRRCVWRDDIATLSADWDLYQG